MLARDQFVDSLTDEDMRLRLKQERPKTLLSPAKNDENETPNIIFKTGLIDGSVDSLIVSGTVEGVPCRMVVDTGSNITIIRPDFLRRSEVRKRRSTNVKSVECSLRTVTGDTTPVRGSLQIQIAGLETMQDVWIAEI